MSDTFLSEDDVATLTGAKTKSKQIQVLRRNGVPFFVNAAGRPVVARVAVEGGAPKGASKAAEPQRAWVPRVLQRV